jgi:tetratricopeptide (TPR) repeat protein
MPLAPASLLAQADAALAEDGDRERSLALVRRALDLSPANRAAHEALATSAGGGEESRLALQRAIRLDPWAIELRDWLALELWRDGRRDEAAAALEESVARYPYLVSHVYPESAAPEPDAAATVDGGRGDIPGVQRARWITELAGGDTLRATLAGLDPELAAAVERGLRRALDERPGGRARQEVVLDLVLLLEARERWGAAGSELRAAAGITPEDAPRLARAAKDFLRAGDAAAAEAALVAALKLTPEQGRLYHELAVEVFARRGDFSSAEEVLRVAQQNSQDMIPVYRGLTKVLSMREAARFDAAALVPEDARAAAARLEALQEEGVEVGTP